MSNPYPNRLVVEDADTKAVVIGLMKYYVNWGKTEDEWPVFVEGGTGKANIFKGLKTVMKASGLKRLGIIVDADSDLKATWDQIAQQCRHIGATPPDECPPRGLIIANNGIKFGAWVMPNNKMTGMVEHFCHDLVPVEGHGLWKLARRCTGEAIVTGAAFPNQYVPKAEIHTWLAWQATPGERMGAAITSGTLGHLSKNAKDFVTWFVTLYELKRRADK